MSSEAARARAIAFYLPQFHPTPENDEWWGHGFTEWTNVRKAKPLFHGHVQPRRPGELGYYDLRDAPTRVAQAELARAHGVESFCYWHYWFGGRRLLDRPFREVLGSGEPDFGFCLAWANHSWTASWVGRPWKLLIEQTYPGRADYESHFETIREAFEDPRYTKVDGKPVFVVFRPHRIPEPTAFAEIWRELAHRAGFPGLFLLGLTGPGREPGPLGLDGTIEMGIGHLLGFQSEGSRRRMAARRRFTTLLEKPVLAPVHQTLAHLERPSRLPEPALRIHDRVGRELLMPLRQSYGALVERAVAEAPLPRHRYPSVLPNWDNTPRLGRWGTVLEGSTPEAYARYLAHAVDQLQDRPQQERLVFLKSWNEWAEGNYLEPDERFGHAFLEATRSVLFEGQG